MHMGFFVALDEPLSLHLEPFGCCLGVVGGAATLERGCHSSSVIQDKRLVTWPLRAAIEVMRVTKSVEEGAHIVIQYSRGRQVH